MCVLSCVNWFMLYFASELIDEPICTESVWDKKGNEIDVDWDGEKEMSSRRRNVYI